jgi:hypothetical protein
MTPLTELAKQCGATEVPVYTPTHRAVIGLLFGSDALTAFVERIRQAEREREPADDIMQPDPYEQGLHDKEAELSSVLPGVTYMDPPDGGSPTVLEQLQRMAQDARRYRWLRDEENGDSELCPFVAGETLDAAIDDAMREAIR